MWASLLVGKAPYLSDSDGRLMAARSSHLIRPSCHVTRTQIAMSYTLPALTCPTLLHGLVRYGVQAPRLRGSLSPNWGGLVGPGGLDGGTWAPIDEPRDASSLLCNILQPKPSSSI